MGDRFVVGVRATETTTPIFIYSQWSGCDRYRLIADAVLAATVRTGDADYFSRIFVSQIIGGHWDQSLGFGLSTETFCMPDYNDVPVVTVDTLSLDIFTCETGRFSDAVLVGSTPLLDVDDENATGRAGRYTLAALTALGSRV